MGGSEVSETRLTQHHLFLGDTGGTQELAEVRASIGTRGLAAAAFALAQPTTHGIGDQPTDPTTYALDVLHTFEGIERP